MTDTSKHIAQHRTHHATAPPARWRRGSSTRWPTWSGSRRAAGGDPENKRVTRAHCSRRTQGAKRQLMQEDRTNRRQRCSHQFGLKVSSGPEGFHLGAVSGRVEDWRAGLGRSLFSPFLALLRVSHYLDRATFPAPATSNAACGFPALRSPVCFTSKVMGPIVLERLSALATEPCSRCTAAEIRTAIAYSTASSRSPCGSGLAPYGA